MTANFDKIAGWYDFSLNQLFFNFIFKRARVFINGYLKPGAKFLDVGCGTGNWLMSLKNYNLELFGVDQSQGMINKAKLKYSEINFNLARAENLPFNDKEFDFISATEAVHHFEDPQIFFSEAFRVLKNNGHFLLIDPVLDGPAKVIWLGLKITPFERHAKFYYIGELLKLIKEAGFTIIKSESSLGNGWILAKKI